MLRGDITVGISCLHYEWQTLDEAFERAAQLRFDVIEFSTTRLAEGEYADCARLAEATGIGTSLHAWGDLAQQRPAEAAGELTGLLDLCAQMAAGHLIMHLGSHPERATGLDRVAQACTAVASAYEQAGVVLCLENHYPYDYHGLNELGGEPADFAHIFQLVPSPAVRFCLDYGHSHMAGNTEAFIAELAPHLAYTHIADNLGEHDDHLGPEEGTVDWPHVLGLTIQAGLRGPFIIEFPERDDTGRFTRFLRVLEAAGG